VLDKLSVICANRGRWFKKTAREALNHSTPQDEQTAEGLDEPLAKTQVTAIAPRDELSVS